MNKYYLRSKKEQESYDAIIHLFNGGLIGASDVGASTNARGTYIEYDGIEFEKSAESGEKESAFMAIMTPSGASWFDRAAGREKKNAEEDYANSWNSFVKDVERKFYEKYSCLVYDDVEESGGSLQAEKCIYNLLKTFFDFDESELGSTIRIDSDRNNGKRIIYGVNMRMEVYDTGEPKPILGKMFFSPKNVGDGIVPLDKNRADGIVRAIADKKQSKVVIDDDKQAELRVESSAALDNILRYLRESDNLLDELVYDRDSKGKSVDEEVIKKFIASVASGEVNILCQSIAVKTLLIINQKIKVFNVVNALSGKAILRAEVCGDRISMGCAACENGTGLIVDNSIVCSNGKVDLYFNNDGKISIKTKRGYLPISDDACKETVELLKKEVFSKHLYKLECALPAGGVCNKCICANRQTEVVAGYDENGAEKIVIKCSDCPYLESFIRIKDENGYKAFAPNVLYFDVDEKRFMPRVASGEQPRCNVCKREIGKDKKRCALCASLGAGSSGEVKQEQRKLYKEYSYMLSPTSRMTKGEKRCAEDQEVIVFRVGNSFYVVNKKELYNGMIVVEKVKRS